MLLPHWIGSAKVVTTPELVIGWWKRTKDNTSLPPLSSSAGKESENENCLRLQTHTIGNSNRRVCIVIVIDPMRCDLPLQYARWLCWQD